MATQQITADAVKIDIEYSLTRINSEASYVKPDSEINLLPGKKLLYKLNGGTNSTSEGKIFIKIDYSFFQEDELLFSIVLNNEFTVKQPSEAIMKIVDEDESFMKNLISLCLHHARGFQASLINNTKLSTFYIPLMPDFAINRTVQIVQGK